MAQSKTLLSAKTFDPFIKGQDALVPHHVDADGEAEPRGPEQGHPLPEDVVGHDPGLEEEGGGEDVALEAPPDAPRQGEGQEHGKAALLGHGNQDARRGRVGQAEHPPPS